MPRDASGNYSLPAGNPVVALTTITSTWANDTMSDLATAITGSLSRAGLGGMLVPLELDAGTVANPSLWFGDSGTGFFRPANDEITLANNGVATQHWGPAQVSYIVNQFGVGGTPVATDKISANGALISSGAISYGYGMTGVVPATTTTKGSSFYSAPSTIASAFTLTQYNHHDVLSMSLGAGSALTTQRGLNVPDLTGAVNNYGLELAVLSGSNKQNLRVSGTAENVIAGSTRFGSTVSPTEVVDVTGNVKVSGSITGGSFVGAILPSSISPLVSPFRNALINGNMEIWQRGTSFASLGTTQTYTADRWFVGGSGAARYTISRSATVPSLADCGSILNYSFLATVTTQNAAPGAGDYTVLMQKIEGFVWRKFWQRALVLTFWVKSSLTGTYAATIQDSAASRSCIINYTVVNANTWEKKTCVFPASPSAGTWDQTTGTGAILVFTLESGTTYNGTAGSYAAANVFSVSGNANLAVGLHNMSWTAVQLEVGAAATEFEDVPFDQSLLRCQRYYTKTFAYSTAPASSAGTTGAVGSDYAYTGGAGCVGTWHFPVVMRASPTVTVYRPDGAGSSWSAGIGASVTESGERNANFGTTGGTSAGVRYTLQATAEAELP